MLCLGTALTFAGPFTVDYVEGDADTRTAHGWAPLLPGDEVETTAGVRLGTGSYVELSGEGHRLSLTGPGIYRPGELIAADGTGPTLGPVSGLLQRIASLFDPPPVAETVPMGTRGADGGADGDPGGPGIDWVIEDDPYVLAEEGMSLLEDGDISAAAAAFDDGLQAALEGTERRRIAYRIAAACEGAGRPAMALSYLERAGQSAARGADVAPSLEHVLLEARLNIETGNFAEAASLLDEFIENDPGVRYAQAAGVLAFSAREALGEREAALRHLRAVVAAAPDSPLGSEANALVRELAPATPDSDLR